MFSIVYYFPYILEPYGTATSYLGLLWWLRSKEPACQCRRCRFDTWVRKIPQRRKWQPTPVFCLVNHLDRRSLAAYSPWSHKELDMT